MLSRILLTGPFCSVSIYMSRGPMAGSETICLVVEVGILSVGGTVFLLLTFPSLYRLE